MWLTSLSKGLNVQSHSGESHMGKPLEEKEYTTI